MQKCSFHVFFSCQSFKLPKNIFNYLPSDKVLDSYKLKAFADDTLYLAEKLKFVLEKEENIVGKFSPFPTMFSKGFYFRVIKSQDCEVKSYNWYKQV